MNAKATDVHQTLAYRRGEIASWMLLIGAVFMLIGAGSTDSTARLWDAGTGKEVTKLAGHAGAVYSVAFTVDGAILTGSADRTIRLWRPNGQAVRVFPSAQTRR